MDQFERFSQAYQQAPWRTQIQILGLFSLILVLVALVSGIYLNLSARKSEAGREIQEMRAKIIELKQLNASMQTHLAHLTSTEVMSERAKDLGFSPTERDEIVYLPVEGYVERAPANLAQKNSTAPAGAVVLPAEYSESLLEWATRQFLHSAVASGGN